MIGAENEHILKWSLVKTDQGSTKLTILPIGIVSIRLLVGVNIGWSRSKIYGINFDKKHIVCWKGQYTCMHFLETLVSIKDANLCESIQVIKMSLI